MMTLPLRRTDVVSSEAVTGLVVVVGGGAVVVVVGGGAVVVVVGGGAVVGAVAAVVSVVVVGEPAVGAFVDSVTPVLGDPGASSGRPSGSAVARIAGSLGVVAGSAGASFDVESPFGVESPMMASTASPLRPAPAITTSRTSRVGRSAGEGTTPVTSEVVISAELAARVITSRPRAGNPRDHGN